MTFFKKTEYNEIVNAIDTSEFVLKTQNNTDKTDLGKEINNT